MSKYIIFAAKKFIAMATITKPKKSKYTMEYITISYNTKNVIAKGLLDVLSKVDGVKVSQKNEYNKEDEFLYNEMVASEKSGKGDINKVMGFLKA